MSKRRNKTRRGKRKSRMELYRKARKTPTHYFVVRVRTPPLVRGGNPFGLGEYTLRAALPPRARLTIAGGFV